MAVAQRFYEFQAEVSAIEDSVPDYRIITFKLIEPSTIEFVPGQFVQVLIEGLPKPASFSIASSPAQKGEVQLCYHKVGRVTGAMSMMTLGTRCKLRGPLGRFTFSAEDGDIVCLAGGVGITPFVSMGRFIRDLKLPNKYTLLYSAKKKEELFFYDELDALNARPNMNVVFAVTREIPDDWQGETRRIDAAMLTTHVPDYKDRTYYVCGPEAFINAMIAILKELDIPPEHIKRELW